MNVEVIDVGRSLTRNLAVEEVKVFGKLAKGSRCRSWPACSMRDFCRSGHDVRLSLSLPGVKTVEQTVRVEGHERRLVRVDVPIQEPRPLSRVCRDCRRRRPAF